MSVNSLQKLGRLVEQARTAQPTTEEEARLSQLISTLLPMIGPFIPEDPAELDALLLTLGRWCIETRSDDAAPAAELLVEAPIGGETA